MKKLVPDPPVSLPCSRRNPEHDRANESMLQALCRPRGDGSPMDALKPTVGTVVGRDSLFCVREGISAEEALLHVSILLKAAEEVSDEITERASGVERGLIWSMIHNVEMARGVVDALLDGSRPPTQA
ncbi:hypothetical protein [Pseudomonas chlororaphis]|uniref:hypothetical protein n=1 Tax=Pseudomonas chlororaphis TaxID=587753 RepID=UPI000561F0B0|nr:hypothetical protein [Pseudomonas chlororaphis]MCP1480988.1 hypothetical protein [Pseudomonas chlororaphis]MCP1592660.1 hypothetical protein [Pseudomonas chlororaphis]WDG55435.1 hypothetical protein PUP76_06590 [Pseudomonas chlororaphis]WDH89364.1 hypothetical protein PUP74_04895 [Pseudomonas chlororaphis]